MSETDKRITYKRVRPNPLFQEWLEELHNEAKEKKSKLESMLKESLESLSKYPVPLESGSECMILKGFHKNLCLYLDKRLEAHTYNLALQRTTETQNNYSISTQSSVSESSSYSKESNVISDVNDNINRNVLAENRSVKNSITTTNFPVDNMDNCPESLDTEPTTNKNKKRCKVYRPAYRSGGFAILIALLEHSIENSIKSSLSKEDLITKAQKYSEESFIQCKPGTLYTAWSNMSRLVAKGLVKSIRSKKVEYYLTEQGKILAKELAVLNKSRPSMNDIIFKDASSASQSISSIRSDPVECDVDMPSSTQNSSDIIEMPAGSFDIILLIDKNETGGVSKKNDPTVAQFNKFQDLKHEYRSLKVGDFTWVARDKQNPSLEFVLPYVVERKRMDDLGASIKDGRFHEQKFRLKKCGLKNIIYLVESFGGNKFVGLPMQNLMQAIANTRVQNGFQIHRTDSLTTTARFLAIFTRRLTIRYMNKNLRGCNFDPQEDDLLMTFDYFNKSSAKTKPLTVKEAFIKLLLQLKGLTVEKALAITSKYSTPYSLITTYVKCDRSEGETLLAKLKYGNNNRNIGPQISKSVYQLFTSIGTALTL